VVPLLNKTYFGGGTVLASTSTERYTHREREREQNNNIFVIRYHVLRKGAAEKFEDGSVAFLNILALRHGLEIFDKQKGKLGGMQRVTAHTFSLAQYLYQQLRSYKHYNGTAVAAIYGIPLPQLQRPHHLHHIFARCT